MGFARQQYFDEFLSSYFYLNYWLIYQLSTNIPFKITHMLYGGALKEHCILSSQIMWNIFSKTWNEEKS